MGADSFTQVPGSVAHHITTFSCNATVSKATGTRGRTCSGSAALQRDSNLKARRTIRKTAGHHKEMRRQWRKQC